MIAKQYSQPPHEVATWDAEWLAAAVTVMEAEAGASKERQRSADRASKRRSMMRGA